MVSILKNKLIELKLQEVREPTANLQMLQFGEALGEGEKFEDKPCWALFFSH